MILMATFSIFMLAQESEWYPQFIRPAADAVIISSSPGRVLDIGTGPGALPAMLASNRDLRITGSDIDPDMIAAARKRVVAPNVDFFTQKGSTFNRFTDAEFDAVTFCSVLFLLDDKTRNDLLNEALRLLKPGGRIIVLTPAVDHSTPTSLGDMGISRFAKNNWTFYAWRIATAKRARAWHEGRYLSRFAGDKDLDYEITSVFYNLAILESIIKKEK